MSVGNKVKWCKDMSVGNKVKWCNHLYSTFYMMSSCLWGAGGRGRGL